MEPHVALAKSKQICFTILEVDILMAFGKNKYNTFVVIK